MNFFLIISGVRCEAQTPASIYTIRKGRMYIELSKNISRSALDSFIVKFNLSELALQKFIRENNSDSLMINGWEIEKNEKSIVAISKRLLSSGTLSDPSMQFTLPVADRFPASNNGTVLGFNKFKRQAAPFAELDSGVYFFLRNNLNAKQVTLAGSFNNFLPLALPMHKTDSGWRVFVKLSPGKYWYKFVVDGDWKVDEDNQLRENDAEGNTNSVYYKTNIRFHFSGYSNAKHVYVAGSFNNWQPRQLAMRKTATGWQLPVYLADGSYTYRFIVDDKWFTDPENTARVPNEFDDFNSLINVGKPYLFVLRGFTEARQVMLFGSFNNWRKGELFMLHTAHGWELPYTLGYGNYQYKFIVDGTELTDPGNPLLTNNDRKGGNSILILGANYTFRLKGFKDAKKIVVSGDFNEFNETAFVMNHSGDTWNFNLYLSPGKHLYKFVVDGNWIIDPANKLWEQNEYGTGNSIVWIGQNNN